MHSVSAWLVSHTRILPYLLRRLLFGLLEKQEAVESHKLPPLYHSGFLPFLPPNQHFKQFIQPDTLTPHGRSWLLDTLRRRLGVTGAQFFDLLLDWEQRLLSILSLWITIGPKLMSKETLCFSAPGSLKALKYPNNQVFNSKDWGYRTI